MKKRYERAWAYISREDRDNDEGWKRVAARSESVLNTCFLYRVPPPRWTKDIWHFEAQRSIRDIFSACITSPYCTYYECLRRQTMCLAILLIFLPFTVSINIFRVSLRRCYIILHHHSLLHFSPFLSSAVWQKNFTFHRFNFQRTNIFCVLWKQTRVVTPEHKVNRMWWNFNREINATPPLSRVNSCILPLSSSNSFAGEFFFFNSSATRRTTRGAGNNFDEGK